MAKLLAFRRSTSEVVTLDTINNTITTLGSALSNVETISLFPGRTQNNVAVYRGDPYLLYLHDTNEIRLAVYQSGAWADVGGFSAITPAGGGVMVPIALRVVQDYLVAICAENGGGSDALIARTSQDGSTWNAPVSEATTAPTEGGSTIVWRNALFLSTTDGVQYFYPLTGAWAAGFDIGSDTLLQGATIQIGRAHV